MSEESLGWRTLPSLGWRPYAGLVAGLGLGFAAQHWGWAPAAFALPTLALAGLALGAWLDTLRLCQEHEHLSVREARERLATVGLMSSAFAHEVRNPLNALLNMLAPLRETLGPQGETEAARDVLGVIDECGHHVRQLSDTLLTFSQPLKRHERVKVEAGLDEALRVLRWKMPAGLEIERSYGAEGVALYGDATALKQVWLNLLDNALRAVAETETKRIEVRTTTSDGVVSVSVTDSGVGIPSKNLAKLFHPFFTTRAPGQGTGLGLVLSERIVSAQGGRIEVQSELGRGACFTVHLPLSGTAKG